MAKEYTEGWLFGVEAAHEDEHGDDIMDISHIWERLKTATPEFKRGFDAGWADCMEAIDLDRYRNTVRYRQLAAYLMLNQ